MINHIFSVLGYWCFILGYSIYASLKYIITGSSVLGKVLCGCIYAGFVSAFLFWRSGFWILLILYGVVSLVGSVLMRIDELKTGQSIDGNDKSKSLFYGLSERDAKTKYRNLMKQYHPDNQGGNLEAAKRINREYELYQSEMQQRI